MDQTFRCRQQKSSEKRINFDILKTIIPKRIEHTRQTTPCFSSTSRALSDCNICFTFGTDQTSLDGVSLCFTAKSTLVKIFVQNMLVNLYLHIF